MSVLELVASVVLVLVLVAVAALVGLAVRRSSLQRGGGFDMSLRTGRGWTGGWVFGVGRFRGAELEWFRAFSLGWRPARTLSRQAVVVHRRHRPAPPESFDLPAGHEVLACLVDGELLEVSLDELSATAFLAWLEAAPPGESQVA